MITALESGEIQVETAAGGRVAVVTSTHRAGTSCGYAMAPVVVAMNPAFSYKGSPPIVKFTVCQFETGHVNLSAVFATLNTMEDGWGGSPTIGGSPQGVSSMFTPEVVAAVVAAHLLK